MSAALLLCEGLRDWRELLLLLLLLIYIIAVAVAVAAVVVAAADATAADADADAAAATVVVFVFVFVAVVAVAVAVSYGCGFGCDRDWGWNRGRRSGVCDCAIVIAFKKSTRARQGSESSQQEASYGDRQWPTPPPPTFPARDSRRRRCRGRTGKPSKIAIMVANLAACWKPIVR